MTSDGSPLAGKVAIVTGGSRGIGRAVAIGLANAGADIAIGARKPQPLEEAVSAVRATGRSAIGVETNVRETESLQRLVDETRRQLGRVDILVNNAATNPVYAPVHELDERAWDVVMNTNLKACFLLSKMAREAIVEHGEGGSIINVSSTDGLSPSPGLGAYAVSKAALIMLTRVCAREWGADGIRVNCLAPGLIKTDFSRALWDDEATLARVTAQSPSGRIGEPEEMAGAVVYLAGPSASFTTGRTLVVDGGQSI